MEMMTLSSGLGLISPKFFALDHNKPVIEDGIIGLFQTEFNSL
jgi:hypothetical protein